MAKKSVRAKFNCYHVEEQPNKTTKIASFNAVYSLEGENADFAKATPWGELKMAIEADTEAYDYFQPGKNYYLKIMEEEIPELTDETEEAVASES